VDTSIFGNQAIIAAKKTGAADARELRLRKEANKQVPWPFDIVIVIRRTLPE